MGKYWPFIYLALLSKEILTKPLLISTPGPCLLNRLLVAISLSSLYTNTHDLLSKIPPHSAMLHAKTLRHPPPSPSPHHPQANLQRLLPPRPFGLQHNLIRQLRTIPRKPPTPVITNRIREHAAIPAKRRSRDAPARRRKRADPHVRVLVPEVERAVRARRAEAAVEGVEGDGVHGVGADDVAPGRVAVALECEVETGLGR